MASICLSHALSGLTTLELALKRCTCRTGELNIELRSRCAEAEDGKQAAQEVRSKRFGAFFKPLRCS